MSDRIGRRGFLGLAGSVAAAAAAPLPAAPPRGRLIVNALGGLYDPNAPRSPDAIQPTRSRALASRLIADAKASGMNAVNVTLGHVAGDMEPFEHSVREIALWEARLRAHPEDLLKVTGASDLLRARDEGRIGIIYGFQNGTMFGDDADRAELFADLGVRIAQLTYNGSNAIGDGSMAPANGGITPFGREVISALNRHRLMVDLSHSGQLTCLEATAISDRPVSINHTGCRALVDLPRNKSDQELRLVASRGGFVGIYFMPYLNPTSVATAQDVVRHIEHAVNVCGEDHVGIGTDGGTTAVDDMVAYRAEAAREIEARRRAGIGATGENPDTLPFVEELSGPDQFRRLVALLESRGHKAARIDKIMGLNFLRFAREIWG